MICLILACLLDLGKTPSKVEPYPTHGLIYQGLVRIRGNVRDLRWSNYKRYEDLARDLSHNFQLKGYTAEIEHYFWPSSERHFQTAPSVIKPDEITTLQDLEIPDVIEDTEDIEGNEEYRDNEEGGSLDENENSE